MADLFPPAGVVIGNPDYGFKETPETNATVITLGDGYESREAVGLNPTKTTYSPVWSNLLPGPAQAAYEFLKARLKVNAVNWVHPVTGVTLKVVPQDVDINYDDYNNAVLNVTFKTDHNPG